jgi:hypothetical protein
MVQKIQSNPAEPNRDSGEETKHIKVCCYPTEPGKYGNNYGAFLTLTEILKMFGGLDKEDFTDKKVKIGFTERPYTNQYGKPSIAKDLGYIKLQDVDVREDVASEQPVLAPPEPLCAPLTGKVTTSVPLPLPDTSKSVGPPISRDLSIIRQVSWKASVELMKALASAGLVNDVAGGTEIAVSLAHSIEKDINR